MRIRSLILVSACLLHACAPPKSVEAKQGESPITSSALPVGSEALAVSFPLLPLVEKSLWRELLAAEARQKAAVPAERAAAIEAVSALSERIRKLHPFQVDGHRLELGGILADKNEGRLSLSAKVHFPDPSDERHPGEVELLLCTETGRTHETLFITEARPLHLELLLHLCGFTKGAEASRFAIDVVARDGTRIPARSLVRAQSDEILPDPLLWDFSGSDYRDLYSPDLSGDFAIFWHAHDSVLRVADESLGSGEVKLEAVSHPLLNNGDMVVLEFLRVGKLKK